MTSPMWLVSPSTVRTSPPSSTRPAARAARPPARLSRRVIAQLLDMSHELHVDVRDGAVRGDSACGEGATATTTSGTAARAACGP